MSCGRRAKTLELKRDELSGEAREEALTHVRTCDECRSELARADESAIWMQRTLSADDSVPPTRVDRRPPVDAWVVGPSTGARIGRFVLGERIGRGAFGSVYCAEAPDGSTVAIKVIAPDRCDEGVRRRFRREAAAVASLRHPAVVTVIDYGETEQGALYLATELLTGEDLARRMARGRLSPEETARIGAQAAAGLAAAHVAGIVHRDVKPANLFLGADGRVVLLDFGLAIRVAGAADTRFTSSDVLIGTPAYMAPEQAQGAGDEDAQTDIWGLGATLFHALAGRPPFDGPTPMAQLVRIVSDEPALPAESAPAWLREALARALTKDRAQRFASMQELERALVEGLAATPGATRVPSSATAAPVAVALGDEVRIVSVLLAEELPDFDAFAAEVRSQHGRPAPLLGRRGVGLFGGEAWRGDEAERAVRAGLAIRHGGGAGRLGVATGRAVRTELREITGDVVAAAEQALSDVGVGTNRETRRRIRGGFVAEGGIVVGTRAGQAVVGVRGLAGADLPIVGRVRELQDLVLSLEQTIEVPQAHGVLVIGPSGIGKSRLRHALAAQVADASRPVLYLEARGESHRSLEGWHAFANALRGWADLPEGTPPERVQERLLASCPSRACAERLCEMLGAPFADASLPLGAHDDPHVRRDQMLVAVGDLFEAWTATQPVLLAFEDVQWADGPSLDVIDVLLRRLEDAPLFVLATSRPEGGAAEGTAVPELRRLPLGGLSRLETRTLVATVLGEGAANLSARADAIHERSGGNPYFVEELAFAVREGRTELPASVEAAVQARLDALPRRDKDLLRRASVLGRRFWAQALAAMGEADPAPILQRLRRAELVAPEPRPRLLGTTEWRFRHAIVQEVALASLTDEQRAALHRGAAAWLSERTDASPAEIAGHFERAGARDEALPFWRKAAERAFSEGDAALGLEASARAIEHETDTSVAFRLRALRAEALQFLGRVEDADLEIAALRQLAGTPAERVLAAARLARSLWLRGRYEEAERVVDEGLATAPEAPQLLVEMTWVCCWSGRLEEGAELGRRAVEGASAVGDVVTFARALNGLSQSLLQRGYVADAREVCMRAANAAESTGDPRFIAAARGFLAYVDLVLGRFESAVHELEKARNLSRASDNRRNEGWALHNRGLALAWMGRVEEGLASERAALAIASEIQEPRLADACRQYLAAILLSADRPEEALATIDEVVGTRTPEGIKTEFRALRAAALVRVGRLEEARSEAEQALSSRAAAQAMWEFEALLFLAAHASGIEGALAEGVAALATKANRISDPAMRESFLRRVPDHALLIEVARAAGLDVSGLA